ncbi:MAG: hypothetical protein JOZ36_12370 [Acidobacteria bacterium]|nr:hypothetical protein [Acidobacteriota bacterium]
MRSRCGECGCTKNRYTRLAVRGERFQIRFAAFLPRFKKYALTVEKFSHGHNWEELLKPTSLSTKQETAFGRNLTHRNRSADVFGTLVN